MCPVVGHWLLIGALAPLVGWVVGGFAELRSRLRGKP